MREDILEKRCKLCGGQQFKWWLACVTFTSCVDCGTTWGLDLAGQTKQYDWRYWDYEHAMRCLDRITDWKT